MEVEPAPPAALLELSKLEEALVHEAFTADTRDSEDHTFSGMFFDLACQGHYPLSYTEVNSVWVRGEMGPMTVWVTPDTHENKLMNPEAWTKVYEAEHPESFEELMELKLPEPIRLNAGERCGLYVHSKALGDGAIVYDDQVSETTRNDGKLAILPGYAHLSNKPFGRRAPWGGNSLRRNRQFVGRVSYGTRWMKWSPEINMQFPAGFRAMAKTIMMCASRTDCELNVLQDEVIFYILNKCGWDWFGKAMGRRVSAEGVDEDEHAISVAEGAGGREDRRRYPQAVARFANWWHAAHFNAQPHGVAMEDESESDEDYDEERHQYYPGESDSD